jgi:hypothetical protein
VICVSASEFSGTGSMLHDAVTADTSVDSSSCRNSGISVVNEVSENKQVAIRTTC